MYQPFQCIAEARPRSDLTILLAASGPRLYAYDLDRDIILSKWPDTPTLEEDEGSYSSTEIITTPNEDNHRAKRRRRALSAKTVLNQNSHTDRDITLLCVSEDQQHIVFVTGADKTVHVIQIDGGGKLKHLSQRQMIKRPCALKFDSHGDSIIIGDKFGDVYSLPIEMDSIEQDMIAQQAKQKQKKSEQPFKPSATELTVHTAGNLKALESQRLAPPQTRASKENMNFSHKLLLGHVSMLTDVISLKISVPRETGFSTLKKQSTRHYIITADRDEHIRVSRGQPQSHIIESYCFGHTQFISKLCHPHPKILVSGGGDDFLIVWDWQSSNVICKLDLRKAVSQLQEMQSRGVSSFNVRSSMSETQKQLESEPISDSMQRGPPIAVSGLYTPQCGDDQVPSAINIFCICEGVPAIFHYWHVFSDGDDEISQLKKTGFGLTILRLDGNPIGIATSGAYIIVAIDNIHEPGFMHTLRCNSDSYLLVHPNYRLCGFKFSSAKSTEESVLQPFPTLQNQLKSFEARVADKENKVSEANISQISDLIYGTEKLRKRVNEDME